MLLSRHLVLLDKTFRRKKNYSNINDYKIYNENHRRFTLLGMTEKIKYDKLKSRDGEEGVKVDLSFADEIYNQSDRQMKLADIIEYIFFSRGVYFLFQSNQYKKERISKFIELNLRFVNMLMVYETMTVDKKLRAAFVKNIRTIVNKEPGYIALKKWNSPVGVSDKDKKRYNKNAPNRYFDSLLPKTAGGLWHEILVYCFILKYNLGYIFPLLLNQKPISLKHKLSPPDIIILHNNTYRYYGIEIGNLKERQSGGFMAPSGIPVIPLDTRNSRISDRCPTCGKWIGICPKVIKDFSNIVDDGSHPVNEIRCLVECNLYSLEDKLSGKCKYMKFRYKNKDWKYKFTDGKHHHFHCCLSANQKLKTRISNTKSYYRLERLNKLLLKKKINESEKEELIILQDKLKSDYSYIKTHSVFYGELISLYKMNVGTSELDTADNEPDQEEV